VTPQAAPRRGQPQPAHTEDLFLFPTPSAA
jgi:hypothetical protein